MPNSISESQEFDSLPLEQQLEYLEAGLKSESPLSLIALCAPLRDPAPLSWLTRRLLEYRWFEEIAHREWFAEFLTNQPETTVHKILKSLIRPPLSESDTISLSSLLIETLKRMPLSGLSAMCLIDRVLQQNFHNQRQGYISELVKQIGESINRGSIDEIELSRLAQVPATDMMVLEQSISDATTLNEFAALRMRLAEEAIAVLESAPKAVSQTNAEDLLARRVYTDPGHFLIELLQNAEDTGAKTWRVRFDKDKLIIWHDGLPFDVRDLVGITSIGQTTKRKQQIGFFGVGFKSVYEITDRPRIYSEVFQFEIADVSIPKHLGRRPADIPASGTALVLPLRPDLDPDRSPQALYKRAVDLDSCVLLTLRNIDNIEFELTETAGGPQKHALIEYVTAGGASIKIEPSEAVHSYLIQDDEFLYGDQVREIGRPDSTRVIIGVRTNGDTPVPLPNSAAKVYSYLPTREQPGLRFFIQGHFDVPVDRERIAPDSQWNRWILAKVPLQLASLAQRIADGGNSEAAHGFIDVLPLGQELPQKPYSQIVSDLPERLSAIKFVPTFDGNLRAAREILVAPRAILRLFGPDSSLGPYSFLAPESNDRARALVLELGGRSFETRQLLDFLEERLRSLTDEEQRKQLPFLFDSERLSILYDLLLQESERLDRTAGDAGEWMLRLRQLPVVLDTDGQLCRAGDVMRGSAAIREIYGSSRHFVEASLDTGDSARTAAFLNKLSIKSLGAADLVDDLEKNLANLPLPVESFGDDIFPGADRLELVLSLLAAADWELKKRASRLPIFQSVDGKYWPVARDGDDDRGVVLAEADPRSRALENFYENVRPIVHEMVPPCCQDKFLRRLNIPCLSLSMLVSDLERALFSLNSSKIEDLHFLLHTYNAEIPDVERSRLAKLTIWPDQNEELWPLEGEKKVFIARDDRICTLFPAAPFLSWQVAERNHVRSMGIGEIDVKAVVEGLCPDAAAPLAIEAQPQFIESALRYILDNKSRLTPDCAATLKERGLFLSDRGRLLPLSELSLADSAQLRKIYGDSEARLFIDTGASLLVVNAARIAVKSVDLNSLATDLETGWKRRPSDDRPSAEAPITFLSQVDRELVIRYLVQNLHKIPLPLIRRFTRLPIYLETRGDAGSLPDEGLNARELRETQFVFPCESPAYRSVLSQLEVRLLAPSVESLADSLLRSAGVIRAGLKTVVEQVQSKPIDSGNLLIEIQQLLVERRGELARVYPTASSGNANPILNSLKIWSTVDKQSRSASEVLGGNLTDLFQPGTPEYKELESFCLPPDTFKRLQMLAPYMVPIPPERFLSKLIAKFAKLGQSLKEQPKFLGSVESIARLHSIVAGKSESRIPYVDAAGNLTFDVSFFASSDTIELLNGLSVRSSILHDGLAKLLGLGTYNEKERTLTAQVARFWTQLTASDTGPSLKPLPVRAVISAVGTDLNPSRRLQFYNWLLRHESEVFYDKEARSELSTIKAFVTSRGTLVKATDLMVEGDIPELGIDWTAGEEIPKPLLRVLAKHLDIGSPKAEELIGTHVRKAYDDAVAASDRERASRLLDWLALRLRDKSDKDVRRLLPSIMIEDSQGNFVDPSELMQPIPEIREYVAGIWGEEIRYPSTRYDVSSKAFLAVLGVRNEPTYREVAIKLSAVKSKRESQAMAGLVGYLRKSHGDEIFDAIPQLRNSAWLFDGLGNLKAPFELLPNRDEIAALVGPFPQKFLDKQLGDLLDPSLSRRLGLREEGDITFSEIADHLIMRGTTGESISFSAYRKIEKAVIDGEIGELEIVAQFQDQPWILTDDGDYVSHKKVMGTRAAHLFGSRRGYWTAGWRECPRLCAELGISSTASPDSVLAFVREIGEEARSGTGNLFKSEPALPLMLLNCFAVLSQADERIDLDLPVIPCEKDGKLDLLTASAPNLFWSDTPSLDALFAKTGALYLAKRGPTEIQADVERFYRSIGIRRLRDSFKVIPESAPGADRSGERVQAIQSLRSTVKALLAVLPRIEIERPLDPGNSWVYTTRLTALAASGSIRIVDKLNVRFELAGVGSISAERPSAYDSAVGELLVDSQVLNYPELTGLAEGLLPAILNGPQAELFVDLFEILIARRERLRMEAYLNQRHFAGAGPILLDTVDVIASRIGDILDYRLVDKLSVAFPQLRGVNFERWRDPELLMRLRTSQKTDPDELAELTAGILIDILQVKETPGLDGLLKKVLMASSINEAFNCLVPDKASDNGAPETVRDNRQLLSKDKIASTEIAKSDEKKTAQTIDSVPPRHGLENVPLLGGLVAWALHPGTKQKQSSLTDEKDKEGFWNKLLGTKSSDTDHAESEASERQKTTVSEQEYDPSNEKPPLPAWLYGNYFQPDKNIAQQLWCTSENLAQLESSTKPIWLSMSPQTLPPPHQYAIQKIGSNFDSITQCWRFTSDSQKMFHTPGTPTGQIVSFSGQLLAGESRLPIPMYSRLKGAVRVSDGARCSIS